MCALAVVEAGTDAIDMSCREVRHGMVEHFGVRNMIVGVLGLAAVMEAGADIINMSCGEVRHCEYGTSQHVPAIAPYHWHLMLPSDNPTDMLLLPLPLHAVRDDFTRYADAATVVTALPAVMLLQPTSRPDVGRAIDIAAETVHKAGVTFVASAGNAGRHLYVVYFFVPSRACYGFLVLCLSCDQHISSGEQRMMTDGAQGWRHLCGQRRQRSVFGISRGACNNHTDRGGKLSNELITAASAACCICNTCHNLVHFNHHHHCAVAGKAGGCSDSLCCDWV
jgi:hypothetical protein